MIDDEDEDVFVDEEWKKLCDVKTVEPREAYAQGWRHATLYQRLCDHSRVCLFFGDNEYEGLVEPYTFVDGVVRDGDGDEVHFIDPVVVVTDVNVIDNTIEGNLDDPELKELEEDGGGYLSNSDDDSGSDFLFGGDCDKKILK